jgi:hypothetical protein
MELPVKANRGEETGQLRQRLALRLDHAFGGMWLGEIE